jgi:hypothetical protein
VDGSSTFGDAPEASQEIAQIPESITEVAQAASNTVSIGKVETLNGGATATRADGSQVTLKIGDSVYQGDTVETSGDGALGLVFVDTTTFSMTQNAKMVLDEMVFDAGTSEGTMSFTVAKGVFSFVSGAIAKSQPDAMSLKTLVATIGIRGTDGAINLPDGTQLTVVIKPDAGGGKKGKKKGKGKGGDEEEYKDYETMKDDEEDYEDDDSLYRLGKDKNKEDDFFKDYM